MQSKQENNIILIRLFTGEEIHEKIIEACNKHKIKTAIILSGIGQLQSATIGYFKGKGNYFPETFNKNLELLSLTGNICKGKNEYLLHLHTILGEENKNTIGGHLIKGKISVTGEIALIKTEINANRKNNDETGLKDLILE